VAIAHVEQAVLEGLYRRIKSGRDRAGVRWRSECAGHLDMLYVEVDT